jgi:pyruvate kinase
MLFSKRMTQPLFISPQVVNVIMLGGGGLMKGNRAWSTGSALLTPSGTPIQRPGTRSLRSTLTNLPLITKPVASSRKTHIICTMGPKCWDEATLGSLLDAGMDIIRLNFSHGDHEGHFTVLDRFRKVLK